MGRLYVIVIVAAALFAAIAGRLEVSHAPARGEVEPLIISEPMSSSNPRYGDLRNSVDHGETILLRGVDGHFYADVIINGVALHMLVDSGASTIALSREDARRAGIALGIGAGHAIGEGAGGTVYGDTVNLDSVAFGGIDAQDFPAVVLSDGPQSLLGQSFLSRFGQIEIAGDRMILRS